MNQKTNINAELAKVGVFIANSPKFSRQTSIRLTLGNSTAIKQNIKELL